MYVCSSMHIEGTAGSALNREFSSIEGSIIERFHCIYKVVSWHISWFREEIGTCLFRPPHYAIHNVMYSLPTLVTHVLLFYHASLHYPLHWWSFYVYSSLLQKVIMACSSSHLATSSECEFIYNCRWCGTCGLKYVIARNGNGNGSCWWPGNQDRDSRAKCGLGSVAQPGHISRQHPLPSNLIAFSDVHIYVRDLPKSRKCFWVNIFMKVVNLAQTEIFTRNFLQFAKWMSYAPKQWRYSKKLGHIWCHEWPIPPRPQCDQ